MDILNVYTNSFLQTCAMLKHNIDNELNELKEIDNLLRENVNELYSERYFWKKQEGLIVLEKIMEICNSEIVKSFLNVLGQRSDLHLLEQIVELLDKRQGETKIVEITVSEGTTQKDMDSILETVKEIFGEKFNKNNVKFNHSNKIVAGFTLKFDSIMVDFSYATKLEKMKNSALNKLNFS